MRFIHEVRPMSYPRESVQKSLLRLLKDAWLVLVIGFFAMSVSHEYFYGIAISFPVFLYFSSADFIKEMMLWLPSYVLMVASVPVFVTYFCMNYVKVRRVTRMFLLISYVVLIGAAVYYLRDFLSYFGLVKVDKIIETIRHDYIYMSIVIFSAILLSIYIVWIDVGVADAAERFDVQLVFLFLMLFSICLYGYVDGRRDARRGAPITDIDLGEKRMIHSVVFRIIERGVIFHDKGAGKIVFAPWDGIKKIERHGP